MTRSVPTTDSPAIHVAGPMDDVRIVDPDRNSTVYTPAATIMTAPSQPYPEPKPLTEALNGPADTPYHGRNIDSRAIALATATTRSIPFTCLTSNAIFPPLAWALDAPDLVIAQVPAFA